MVGRVGTFRELIDAIGVDPADTPTTPEYRAEVRAELQARVFEIVSRTGGTGNLPEDVLQTIARQVLDKLVERQKVKGPKSDAAYVRDVRRFARIDAIDFLYSAPHLRRVFTDAPFLQDKAVERPPLDESRLAGFKARLDRLPQREQRLLQLAVAEDETIARIGERKKLSFSDAAIQLFRLFSHLRA